VWFHPRKGELGLAVTTHKLVWNTQAIVRSKPHPGRGNPNFLFQDKSDSLKHRFVPRSNRNGSSMSYMIGDVEDQDGECDSHGRRGRVS